MAAIDADIKDIARTIWATLFELPLEDGDAAQLGPESTVTSCVHIDGAWHGAVVLQCPLTLARTLTAAMFQADAAPELDEVHDALGELANMVGGNVKALLPGTVAHLPAGRGGRLGLPHERGRHHRRDGPVLHLRRAPAARHPPPAIRAGRPRGHVNSVPDRRGPDRVATATVLVVDDSTAIRRILQRALENAGYRVTEAADGQAALTACRTDPPISCCSTSTCR